MNLGLNSQIAVVLYCWVILSGLIEIEKEHEEGHKGSAGVWVFEDGKEGEGVGLDG